MISLPAKLRKLPHVSAPSKSLGYTFSIRKFSHSPLRQDAELIPRGRFKNEPTVEPLENGQFRLCLELPGKDPRKDLIHRPIDGADSHGDAPVYESRIKKWLDENPNCGEGDITPQMADTHIDPSNSILKRVKYASHLYRNQRLKNIQKFTTKYIRPHPTTGLLPLQPEIECQVQDRDSSDLAEQSSMSSSLTPYNLFRGNKNRLTVTDMTTQYCEVRSFYELCGLKRVYSKQVAAGTKYHKELEDQVVEAVKINPEIILSKEDEWWLKFLRIQTMLEALIKQGNTREVYVFANIGKGKIITGIIDELQLVDKDGNQLSEKRLNDIRSQFDNYRLLFNSKDDEEVNVSDWYVKLTDTKTRGTNNLPPESQRLSAYHQLLLYHSIFSSITCSTVNEINDILTQKFDLDIQKQVNPDIIGSLLEDTGINYSDMSTLETIIQEKVQPLFNFFKQRIYHEIEVDYIHTFKPKGSSKTFEPINRIKYQFSKQDLDKVVDFRLDFWNGARNPIGVGYDEMQTKCVGCVFKDNCKWRYNMRKQLLQ